MKLYFLVIFMITFVFFLGEVFFFLIAGSSRDGMSIHLPHLQSFSYSLSWAFSQVKVKEKKFAPC